VPRSPTSRREREPPHRRPGNRQGPAKYFARVVEIDLSTLEPHLVGPHTPDLARPISQVAAAVAKESYPDQISVALIGSCTNSSYEDISRVTDVVLQAKAHGIKASIPFLVTPGSEQIRATIVRDGQMSEIQSVGGHVLANACGHARPMEARRDQARGRETTIVTSYNRNFPARNDGSRETLAFMGSPEIVAAYALAGRLSFNPLKDTLQGRDGKAFKLNAPKPRPIFRRTVSSPIRTAIWLRRRTARRFALKSPRTASVSSS
jgi:aconitate hydratase